MVLVLVVAAVFKDLFGIFVGVVRAQRRLLTIMCQTTYKKLQNIRKSMCT